MEDYYAPTDLARVAMLDQSHALLRDFCAHLREHCRIALAEGNEPRDVAFTLATSLYASKHTRETLATLLGLALTDLTIAYERRRR